MGNEFERLDLEEQLKNDFEFFINFVHKRLENQEFIWSPYNKRLRIELENTYKLKYLMLVINIPPRLGKTVLLTYFIAFTIYKSGNSVYNNYYTYSDLLVERLYSTMEKIFKIPEIAETVDSNFKKRKEDFSNSTSSGVYATTVLGKTTGMGAGIKDEDGKVFSGMIVIDDPSKASDSVVRMASTNRAIKSAILNRKNNFSVPIIVIMQRLHKMDLTGFLLNFYEDWFLDGRALLLKMPVLKDGKTISKREYPLDLIELEKQKDENYFYCQLQQEPMSANGKFFKNELFQETQIIDKKKSIVVIYFNPENATEPIVFLACKKENNNMVILDYFEDKLEPLLFFNSLIDFCNINNSKKVYIPKSLTTKAVKQKLQPIRVEEVEDIQNIELEAFYNIGLLEKGKILLKDDDLNIALKEELVLFPQSERDYVVKSVITALEILFIKGGSRLSSSI